MSFLENISLKKYNSFGIDVKARYFAEPNTVEDILEIIKNKVFLENKYLILGGGNNILFTKDYDGFVLKINNRGIEVSGEETDFVLIRSAAGEEWDDFVVHCINNKYYGLENLSMIPGNIGSGPIQNIGAYGVELSDVFHSLEAINIKTGKKEIFTRDECKFGYRDSIFKTEFKDRFIIISVTFKLTKTANFKIDYADIQKEIQQNNISNIDAQTIRDIVCRIRQSKLPFPSILGNAGSFFKNPVIKQKQLNYLRKIYPDIKYYCLPDITYKVAAGWLIEKSGWKGKRIGDAGVHKDQALILVNYGNASGSDILNIAKEIEDSVINEFGIPLESEVNII